MSGLINLHGQRFGHLTVIGRSNRRTASRGACWICKCDCGNVIDVEGRALRIYNKTHCGCMPRGNCKHGHCRDAQLTKTYATWHYIKAICLNPKNRQYVGDRISIDQNWINDFRNFLIDMGVRPNRTHLKLNENSFIFCKENCSWVPFKKSRESTNIYIPKVNRKSTLKDEIGKRYGKLLVLERINKGKCSIYKCLCDCGNITNAHAHALRTGHKKSCGCYKKFRDVERNTKHGHFGTPIYKLWQRIKSICTSETHREYIGDIVSICDKWLNFEGFFEDMGEKPNTRMTLLRIDPYGDYDKNNCYWGYGVNQRIK